MGTLVSWLNKPFNSQGSAVQWFAFIGFILVCLWMWHAIARDFSAMESAD